jgi:diketogulonate reductase-like aldo/keto reductase
METNTFGWTGAKLPVIGQGTWRMGESARHRLREIESLRCGLELGMTHIDTAEMYGSGRAEEIVAEAIRGRRRSDLFLVSKVLPQHASYDGTIRAAEQSLRRLRTDYLDLYLLHWPGRYPIGETMRAMEDLVGAGKLRYLGVSNFDREEMREAIASLSRERLACNQVLYNLMHRGIEVDLIPYCRKIGVAVVGYTPFGGMPRRGTALRVLERIAAEHGVTPRQIVLRFLTRLEGIFAIPKASHAAHVRENAGACGFSLSSAALAALDQVFPRPAKRVPLATG